MTSTIRWIVGGTATLIVLAAGLASWIIAGGEPTKPDPNSRSLVARGKVVYAQQCAPCHGANLEGQPNWRERLPNGRLPGPPHDATDTHGIIRTNSYLRWSRTAPLGSYRVMNRTCRRTRVPSATRTFGRCCRSSKALGHLAFESASNA